MEEGGRSALKYEQREREGETGVKVKGERGSEWISSLGGGVAKA